MPVLSLPMQSLAHIRDLLSAAGLSPRRAFGQNFLIDHNLLKKLVDSANLAAGEVVLEIGPGTGTMTEELLERGVTVIAAEIDRGLSNLLRDRFKCHGSRFELVEGDCLEGKRALSPALRERLSRERRFKLVSNLPYAAGTPAMSVLHADVPACVGQFVTIQREVAERLMAKPGTKDYGPVSVLVQAVASVQLIALLPPECFWPRPEVTSAMVAMHRVVNPATSDARALFDFAQKLFEQRRKQLGSILGRMIPWPAGVSPLMRAEELSVEQFEALRLVGPVTR